MDKLWKALSHLARRGKYAWAFLDYDASVMQQHYNKQKLKE